MTRDEHPIESALVVIIPEAEVLVESFRKLYDPSAALGVPAHVTVLYPFQPPSEITEDVVQSLEELFSKLRGFHGSFAESKRFPGVLYLLPAPDEAFRMLIRTVTGRFPEVRPYDGRFTEPVPHLTVAQVADEQQLEKIVADFKRAEKVHLPIRHSVREIALMDNESGLWKVRHRFALGG